MEQPAGGSERNNAELVGWVLAFLVVGCAVPFAVGQWRGNSLRMSITHAGSGTPVERLVVRTKRQSFNVERLEPGQAHTLELDGTASGAGLKVEYVVDGEARAISPTLPLQACCGRHFALELERGQETFTLAEVQ